MLTAKSSCEENQQKCCKYGSKHFKRVLVKMEDYNGNLSNFQNTTFHKDRILLSDKETINVHILFQVLSLNFNYFRKSLQR